MKSSITELRAPLPAPAAETIGTVLARMHDHMLLVACADARLPCRRALSCLIEPVAGDRVVVSHADPKCAYVLAILERSDMGEVRIDIDGDMTFGSTGMVRVQAARGIDLDGQTELLLHGDRIALNAKEAELEADTSSFHCAELRGRAGALSVIARTFETVVERVVQISKSSFRTVETVDHVRSAHLDYAASESVRLHGKHALLTADRLSKIDAQHIHLG